MNRFFIHFTDGPVVGSQIGNGLMLGEIVLGDYREGFESFIGFWSQHDYEMQWGLGVQRAAAEGQASCLITSITDPTHAEFLRWWLIYPLGETVAIQESLLLFDQLSTPFSTADPYRSIPARVQITDEGQPVSEWELPRDALREFLDNRNRR